ncbi:MAG: AI-2E family transporter, partial [Lewinella sp.]|nr:AI-2E family transporter [Lewinella sp.]
GLAGMFFALQLSKVVAELPDIASGLTESVEELTANVGKLFKMNRRAANRWLSENLAQAVKEPLTLISASLSSTTAILLNFALVLIYTFLFLLYRSSFKRFLLQQFGPATRSAGSLLLFDVQQVAKKYFVGILTVALILGMLNSLGLYFIGIDFPILWGFLAATLSIIPYIGTILGGLLPFLYSFAAGDGYWQPVAIVVLYTSIQALEGNFITPKVVGRSVNINPLIAIVALFFGGKPFGAWWVWWWLCHCWLFCVSSLTICPAFARSPCCSVISSTLSRAVTRLNLTTTATASSMFFRTLSPSRWPHPLSQSSK